jgi:hypothetical protein
MNIEKLYESLENLRYFYNDDINPDEIELCEIDNKIYELKDLLYDAIQNGLKDKEDNK